MFGLQLFPEASIDYWLRNVELIDHDNLVVDAARSFSEQGFLVLVKDHPSQFGFRQRSDPEHAHFSVMDHNLSPQDSQVIFRRVSPFLCRSLPLPAAKPKQNFERPSGGHRV